MSSLKPVSFTLTIEDINFLDLNSVDGNNSLLLREILKTHREMMNNNSIDWINKQIYSIILEFQKNEIDFKNRLNYLENRRSELLIGNKTKAERQLKEVEKMKEEEKLKLKEKLIGELKEIKMSLFQVETLYNRIEQTENFTDDEIQELNRDYIKAGQNVGIYYLKKYLKNKHLLKESEK